MICQRRGGWSEAEERRRGDQGDEQPRLELGRRLEPTFRADVEAAAEATEKPEQRHAAPCDVSSACLEARFVKCTLPWNGRRSPSQPFRNGFSWLTLAAAISDTSGDPTAVSAQENPVAKTSIGAWQASAAVSKLSVARGTASATSRVASSDGSVRRVGTQGTVHVPESSPCCSILAVASRADRGDVRHESVAKDRNGVEPCRREKTRPYLENRTINLLPMRT